MEVVHSPAAHPRMRSSIACARCRRSKIKCLNAGVNTTCKACESSGRECVYPAPAVGGASGTKREGDNAEKVEVKRPRTRKNESTVGERTDGGGATGPTEVSRPLADALDPTVLTPAVWQQVFDLFQLHFSTDLPFLHGPTFLGPLCDAAMSLSTMLYTPSEPKDADMKLPGLEMLLLGLLALTARFHPGLIAYHSSASSDGVADPVIASDYYATALKSLLVGTKGVYIGQPNLQKIQALLMLGLHEWGMCKGIKAWIHVGLAIRMAQAMGLQFEDTLDNEPLALSSAMRIEAQHLGVGPRPESPLDPSSSQAFIEEEVRRRTFWSCFIMDRYLSSGKYRPAMLNAEEIRIQLPSSEKAFAFGERVCTGLLNLDCSGTGGRARRRAFAFSDERRSSFAEDDNNPNRRQRQISDDSREDASRNERLDIPCEFGVEECILSRFIRMVEIWGKIAKWSCAGGRR